jgi:hypothetical protein
MSHVEKVLKSPHAAAVVEQHPPSANLPSANMVKEVTPSRNTIVRPANQSFSTMAQIHYTHAQPQNAVSSTLFDSPSSFVDVEIPRVEGAVEAIYANVSMKATLAAANTCQFAPNMLVWDRIEVLTGSSVADQIITMEEEFEIWRASSDRDDRINEGGTHGFGARNTAAGAGGDRLYMNAGTAHDRPQSASATTHTNTFSLKIPCFLDYGVKLFPALLAEDIKLRFYFRPKASLVLLGGSTLSSLSLDKFDCTVVHIDVPRSIKQQLAQQYSSTTGVTFRVLSQVRSDHAFSAIGNGTEYSQILQSHAGYCAGLLVWWSDDSLRDQGATPFPLDTVLPASIQYKDEQQREVLPVLQTRHMVQHLRQFTGFPGTHDHGADEGPLWIPFGAHLHSALKDGVCTGGYQIDDRDMLHFVGNAKTAAAGACTLHIVSLHYATLTIKKGKIDIRKQS